MGGLPCVVVSTVCVARRNFLGLRTTGVLTLSGVTALSSVVDPPLEGGAEGRAELVTFVLLERPGIFPPFTCHVLGTWVKGKARGGLYKYQERLRKQFSPLWSFCEARAGLFKYQETSRKLF